MPYQSRISGWEELRPIASTLIGAEGKFITHMAPIKRQTTDFIELGSDLMLIKLAEAAFTKASWPTSIQTGRHMYPPANNTRNVGSAAADSFVTYEIRRQALQEIHKEFEHGGKDRALPCEMI